METLADPRPKPIEKLIDERLEKESAIGHEENVRLLENLRLYYRLPEYQEALTEFIWYLVERASPVCFDSNLVQNGARVFFMDGPILRFEILSSEHLPPEVKHAIGAYRTISYLLPWTKDHRPFFHHGVVFDIIRRKLNIGHSNMNGVRECRNACEELSDQEIVELLSHIDPLGTDDFAILVTLPCKNGNDKQLIMGHMAAHPLPASENHELFPDTSDNLRADTEVVAEHRNWSTRDIQYYALGRFTIIPRMIQACSRYKSYLGEYSQIPTLAKCVSSALAAGGIIVQKILATHYANCALLFEGNGEPHISIKATQQFGLAHRLTPDSHLYPTQLSIPPILFERFGDLRYENSQYSYKPKVIQGMLMDPYSCIDGLDMPDRSPCPYRRAMFMLNYCIKDVWPQSVLQPFLGAFRNLDSFVPWGSATPNRGAGMMPRITSKYVSWPANQVNMAVTPGSSYAPRLGGVPLGMGNN
jgi:hypothetical protein